MPTYTVKKGDTMWSLTSRALREQTGRKPTNAEINAAMRAASRGPRANKNLIKPGETVRIYLPGARGSDPAPRKRTGAGARAASAADRYGNTPRKSTAKKATKKSTSSSNMNKFRSGERAASTSIKKKTAPAGGSASRWGKSRGAVPRAIRNAGSKQQARLNARKKYYPGS